MPFTVQELIKDRRRPITVGIADTAQKAIDLMMEHDFSQLPVIDHDERPQGMVTSDSIIRAHTSLSLPLKKLHVRDAMAKKPREFKAADDLFEMLEYVMDAAAIFIVDGEGRLIGIVTSYDTTEYFRRRAEDIMLVEDIETGLREHIRSAHSGLGGLDGDALKTAIGEVVWDRGGQRKRFKAALKKYMGLKQLGNVDDNDANKVFDEVFAGSLTSELEDLNFSEYIQMLLSGSKWDAHFRPIFGVEREALRFMLEGVRETRNALAHFRGEITSTQRNHLRFSGEWLGRHQPVVPTSSGATSAESVAAAPPMSPPAAAPKRSEDPEERARAEEIGEQDSRYTPLAIYLQAQMQDRVDLSFSEVEDVIGGKLPAYARTHRSWWANDAVGHVQSRQWLEAGWRVVSVNMVEEKVAFYRPTERGRAYITFFTALLAELEKASPGFFKAAQPNGSNWITVRHVPESGPRVAFLAFAFTHRSRFRVELYIDSGERDRNKEVFNRLHDRKHEIEALLGDVSWERLDEKRASRVAVYQPGKIDDPPENLAELQAWGVENIIKLRNAVAPSVGET